VTGCFAFLTNPQRNVKMTLLNPNASPSVVPVLATVVQWLNRKAARQVKLHLILLIVLGVSTFVLQSKSVNAQAVAATPQDQMTRMAIPKGVLFKATKDGKTIHLFGTMHVGLESSLPLGRQVITSLAEAQALLLELDFSDPNLLAEFNKHTAAKKPVMLTTAQREIALSAAKTLNMPAEQMLSFRPMMLASMVTIAQGTALGFKADHGSDLFLFGAALRAKIPVIGMESVQDQLKMEDELTEFELDQMVQEAFRDVASKRASQVLQEMSAAWLKGDLEGLARISEVTENAVNKKILKASNKRNYSMVEKMIATSDVASKPIFAAAGALHFWGTESIQALLQKRGYQIERIH
jgi:uncharacterized protein